MPTENGSLKNGGQADFFVEFSQQGQVEFLIVTGFNGFLCMPRKLLKMIQLKATTSTFVEGVGTHQDIYDVALAEIVWFGKKLSKIEVLINDGDDYLLGTALLENAELYINYKTGEVLITET